MQFSVNASRFDPYKNYKFRVKYATGGDYVAGISKVSALKRTTEVVEHREGGDPSPLVNADGSARWPGVTSRSDCLPLAGDRKNPGHCHFRQVPVDARSQPRRRSAGNLTKLTVSPPIARAGRGGPMATPPPPRRPTRQQWSRAW